MASPFSFPRPAPAPALASGNAYRGAPSPQAPPYQSDQTYDPVHAIESGYDWLKGKLGGAANGIANALNPQIDLTGVRDAQKRAFNLQDQLAAERAGYGGNYSRVGDASLAAQQQGNIADLANAAAGRVPSPAEIQLQQAGGLNAARQFGLAAALQGRNPGAALRSGRLGSLATQNQTNVEAAMMRAKEQEAARQALIQALSSARTEGQNLNAQDIDWRKALLGGTVNALNSGTTAAGQEADAQAKNAASRTSFLGGLTSTAGDILGSIF